MADVKINDLSAVTTASGNMQLETDIGGTTANKITVTQLATYVQTQSDSSDFSNASSVAGGTVTDALNNLDAAIPVGALADLDTITSAGLIENGIITVSKLDTTGTPSSSTYLRGDGAWASVAGGVSQASVDANTSAIAVNESAITSLAAVDTSINSRITSVQNGLTSVDSRFTSVNSGISSVDSRITSVQGNVASNDTEISNLQTSVQGIRTSLRQEVSVLEVARTSLGSSLTSLEGTVGTHETEIGNLQTSVQSFRTSLASGISSVDSRITSVESALTENMVSLTDTSLATGAGTDGYAVTWKNSESQFVLTSVGGAATSGGATQDLWETITADSGSTTANSPTDNLTIAGGLQIGTSITGDILTVYTSNVPTQGSVDANTSSITVLLSARSSLAARDVAIDNRTAAVSVGLTSVDQRVTSVNNLAVYSDPTAVSGATSVENMFALTSAQYAGITTVSDVFYIITDAS